MRVILMSVFVIVAALAGAATGYLYGVDQGRTEAQNVRAEFLTTRTAAGNTQPTGQTTQQTQPAQSGQGGQGQAQGQGQGQQRNPAGLVNLRGAVGTIKSVQGNTMQVTAADGSTVNVAMDAQTTIEKLAPATNADLQVGQRITVQGNLNSGTVTARTIILGLGQ